MRLEGKGKLVDYKESIATEWFKPFVEAQSTTVAESLGTNINRIFNEYRPMRDESETLHTIRRDTTCEYVQSVIASEEKLNRAANTATGKRAADGADPVPATLNRFTNAIFSRKNPTEKVLKPIMAALANGRPDFLPHGWAPCPKSASKAAYAASFEAAFGVSGGTADVSEALVQMKAYAQGLYEPVDFKTDMPFTDGKPVPKAEKISTKAALDNLKARVPDAAAAVALLGELVWDSSFTFPIKPVPPVVVAAHAVGAPVLEE